jgi:hypothetical protein
MGRSDSGDFTTTCGFDFDFEFDFDGFVKILL